MDKKTSLHYIDQWGNFYLRMLGEAEHLELIEKDLYTILRPKNKIWASIFDVQLEHLQGDELIKTVDEIKSMNQHVWWNQYSNRVNDVVFPEGRREPTPDDDEVFAVMTPNEMPIYQNETINVRQAINLDDFKIFRSICFDKNFSPDNYLSLYKKGMICCYIGYENEIPVSAIAVLTNEQVFSLELASTLSEHRRKGYAAAVCRTAIKEAFSQGAKVLTIRAGGGPAADDSSKYLGEKLGFEYI
jgi:hypothetical protein